MFMVVNTGLYFQFGVRGSYSAKYIQKKTRRDYVADGILGKPRKHYRKLNTAHAMSFCLKTLQICTTIPKSDSFNLLNSFHGKNHASLNG